MVEEVAGRFVLGYELNDGHEYPVDKHGQIDVPLEMEQTDARQDQEESQKETKN